MKAEAIDQIVAKCDGSAKSIKEAVGALLMEETEISVGDTVAAVDDDLTIGGFVGKGKVKGFSETKQWADIELPDGSVTQAQTSLLYLVK